MDHHDQPVDEPGREPADGDTLRPADRLRARAEVADRASRFELRLAEVRRLQARRRRVRRLVRLGWAIAFAALGALSPILIAAVRGGADPGGGALLAGAAIGATVGAVGPYLRSWLARRRGARAWDAYNERYVLLGDPSAEVRDADRDTSRSGILPRPDQPR